LGGEAFCDQSANIVEKAQPFRTSDGLAVRSTSTDLNWPYFQAQRLADRMSATMTGMQYLTDVDGKRTGVILSLEQYEQLVQDVHDLAVVGDRLDEEPITFEELKERLRLSPC
jgi:hypothetical protein